jgi:RimJ/RimL family protein N-acetyltransferase
MPRSAQRVDVGRPQGAARSAEDRARFAERVRDAREFAALQAQLGALEQDIRSARSTARRTAAAPALGLLAHPAHASAPPPGEHVRLRDGAEIVVRQIQPTDAALLKTGFERLGALSRYRRFLTPIDHLSPHQLAYLTEIDHTSHEALAAVDPMTGEGVGIARYLRDHDDPRQAEVAVVVADAWQGRGVGTALGERLIARARAAGIDRITARMLVDNEAARRLLAHAADTVAERSDGATVSLTARLTT